jgi:hypothetical protein
MPIFLVKLSMKLDMKVIWKVTLSLGLLSPPIPSFSGIHKVRRFLWNLSMKCWNSTFNAQGSRVIIVVVQVGTVKIYVAEVGGAQEKRRQDETQLPPKLVEKLGWVPVILLCKSCIPCYAFDALLCWNWRFAPPNRKTLQITLMESASCWEPTRTKTKKLCRFQFAKQWSVRWGPRVGSIPELSGLGQDLAKSDLAFWECPSPILGLTYCKAKGEQYHKFKHPSITRWYK